MITAERLMLVGGIAVFLLTISWVRTRELREKYGLMWLGVATLVLLVGVFPDYLEAMARQANLSYPALVLFMTLGLLYPFSFFVTVSLSRQYRRSARLLQEVALLECRVRELEKRLLAGQSCTPS